MTKILFPTEFASNAAGVFQYGLAIADGFNAKIVMMHAFGMPEHPDDNPNFEERAAAVVDEILAFKAANLPEKYQHIETEYVAEIGFPADAILKVAEDEKVDLIVMGTQGKTNAMEKYLGGIASQVIDKASCPVLLIPPSAKFSGFKHFACTTSFDFRDLFVFNMIINWAKIFKAEIECLHVLQKGENVSETQSKVDLLKELFHGKANFQFQITSGDLEQKIEEFSKNTHADVLAMIHHHKSFLTRLRERNVIKDVAKEIHTPLLVLMKNE